MKDFIKLTKDMVTLWITESRTWEVNQEHKFQFEDWYLSFKKSRKTLMHRMYMRFPASIGRPIRQ